jgi:regulator of protease activity HflC (stomatin/prohibitin superfamily)
MEPQSILIVVGIVIVVVLVARVVPPLQTITVYEYEQGLRYRDGRLVGPVAPGRYRLVGRRTSIVTVDTRARFVTVPGQEVLSADGVTIKTSLAAQYEVTDARAAIQEVAEYEQALYLTLQLALRQAISTRRIEEVVEARAELGPEVLRQAAPIVERFGLRLIAVDIKDVMFPGDLKRIFAQVIQAQREGQAALERARGETAALRNLANAARLVEGNPALLQLRALQQLGSSAGNTLILGMPASTTPIPVTRPDGSGHPELRPGASEAKETAS